MPTNEKGLTSEEAARLLKQYGPNEIKQIGVSGPWLILVRQIRKNFILYLLAATVIISFAVGKTVTAYAIIAVIVMVISVGFVQEYRAESAINALKNMLVPVSWLIRNGRQKEIPSSQIVPGDVILLRSGERVPADCIILEEKELRLNEAVLTGEAKEVGKSVPTDSENPKDENLVFMGTFVVNGRALVRATHTGMNTRFGKIAKLISQTEKELPLQHKVNRIANFMVLLAITISVLTGLIMISRASVLDSTAIVEILILVIALAVSAFPEGFPVVLITTLAAGAHRMARQNAIVNRMSIIETLGETTIICSDKTGTLTKGEMTVRSILTDSHIKVSGTGYEALGEFKKGANKINPLNDPALKLILINSVLCNDAAIERTGEDDIYAPHGSPTEAALLILAAKAGLFKDDLNAQRVQEIPFNSERKMMSVMCEVNGEKLVLTKGAPEFVLKKCSYLHKGETTIKMTQVKRQEILKKNSSLTSQALRTLAFAYKKVSTFSKDHFEEELIYLGVVAMEDPPREEAKSAIELCRMAGIKVKMSTGDNKETALAVAKEVGLNGALLEGHQLEEMTDEELEKAIADIVIFARVKPEHKLRLIKALKANGEIVTMTGDGVNDAPALKEAHIGVAMGKNGTDVSRSVADLTLKDDNFKTIVSAIAEGRTVFKNIRKFATYQLSCNLAELSLIFWGLLLASYLGWPVPLLMALQILFMNLVTDNLPAITLGLNKSSSDVMREKPRRHKEILTWPLIGLLIFNGVMMLVLTGLTYWISFNLLGASAEYARTVALFTLICLEIASAFTFRSFRKGVLERSLLVNRYLFWASVISLIATILIIYTPVNQVFYTVPLKFGGLAMGVYMALVSVVVYDLLKRFNSRKPFFEVERY